MLYIFDKDGTLIPEKEQTNPKVQLLPNVLSVCQLLRRNGHQLAIATNQGGIAFGIVSMDQVKTQLLYLQKLIDAELSVFCPYHPNGTVSNYARDSICRKPAPGMIIYIVEKLNYLPQHTTYVGDRETDKQAAVNAAVRFEWAADFFRR